MAGEVLSNRLLRSSRYQHNCPNGHHPELLYRKRNFLLGSLLDVESAQCFSSFETAHKMEVTNVVDSILVL